MATKRPKFSDKVKEAMINPQLDKVKAEVRAALKQEKENPQASNLSISLLENSIRGLNQDLNELGIKDPQQRQIAEKALREKFEELSKGSKDEAIAESLEGKKLDTFVNSYASYSKLDSVIEQCENERSKKPMNRFFKTLRAATPLLAGIGATLSGWLAGLKGKDEKAKDSKLNRKAAKADKAGEKKDDKKTEKSREEGKTDQKSAGSANGGGVEGGGGSSSSGGGSIEGTEVESMGRVDYEMDIEDTKEKLSPAKFKERYESIKNRTERHKFVLAQIAAGNINNSFEKLKVKGKTGMTVEFEVDRTGLRVAGMDVQLDGPTAMAAAMLTGCTLPTKWVVDQTYMAAQAKGGKVDFVDYRQIVKKLGIPEGQAYTKVMKDGKEVRSQSGKLMMSAEFALARDEILKAQRSAQGISEDQLQAGHFKDVIHPVPGVTTKGMLEIYGGVYANGQRVQGLSAGFHEPGYADYSHGVRRVRNTPTSVTVRSKDGEEKKMSFAEFNANPEYGKEFGFQAHEIGTPYVTKELEEFVDKKKPKDPKKDKPVA